MNTETPRPAPREGLLARLPVGKSVEARMLMVAAAVLTAACVWWIQQLRFSGDPGALAPIFYVLFTYFDYDTGLLALGILLVAIFVPRWDGVTRLLAWIGDHAVALAVTVAVLLSLGTLFVYHDQPLSMDEFAPYFQSQVFANGQLSGRFPVDLLDHLVPEGFQNFFLNVSKATGEVSSNYWPGFALLLTPFTLLGIPWACNPVLAGLSIVVLNRLARRLFGSSEAAGAVTLFTVASPVFFANGISYYSMTAHMLANALFMLLLLEPTPRRLFTAGIVGSLALTLHNPVPHMLFALPWFVWLATRGDAVRRLGVLAAGYLPLSLLLGVGWFLHSGQLAQGAQTVAGGVGTFDSITFPFAWPNGNLFYARLVGLAKLMLWAVPGVLLLALAGAWRTRHDARFVTLAVSALLTFVGYLFVWADQGHGWGFRYFHSAWLALPVFATGFLFAPSGAAAPAPPQAASPEAVNLRTYVVSCALLSLVLGVSQRAAQIDEFMTDHLNQLPGYEGTEPRVVLVSGVGFYPYDLVHNHPYLRGDLVLMVDLGAERNAVALRSHFPDYHLVYRDRRGEVWSAATPTASATPP
jgi:hypothetical protein